MASLFPADQSANFLVANLTIHNRRWAPMKQSLAMSISRKSRTYGAKNTNKYQTVYHRTLDAYFPSLIVLILVFTNPFPDPRVQPRQTHDVSLLAFPADERIVEPKHASVEELCTFHDEEYIEFLLSAHGSPRPNKRKRSSSTSSSSSSSEDPYENYGLEYVFSSLNPTNKQRIVHPSTNCQNTSTSSAAQLSNPPLSSRNMTSSSTGM